MLKNDKGITLTSLVITIIVLLILASVATVSGMGAIDYIKFNNAKAQFQTMQSQVNAWYEELKNNTDVSSYGEDLNTADATIVSTTIQEGTESDDNTGFKYFSADYITNTLGIEGISYDFLINASNATVLLYGGITYQDKTYYSAKDFGIDVITFEELSSGITFETKAKIIDNNGYIIVYNIEFDEDIDISKYDVQYQKDGDKYWTTLTSDKKYTYEYVDGEGNAVTDKNAWRIPSPIPIDDIEGKMSVRIVTVSDEIKSDKADIPVQWVTEIKFDTDFRDNKIIASNIQFLYEGEEVTLSTYNVRYRNDGEEIFNDLTYDTDNNYWYLTVENSTTDVGNDYIPYIDEDKIEKNIRIKVFTKSEKVASVEQNECINEGYESYVGKTVTEKTKLRDRDDKIIWVPEGFTITEDSKRKGLDINEDGKDDVLIRNGIVVKAPDGSEFVWVPVADINSMANKTSGTDTKGRTNYQGKLYDFSLTYGVYSATEKTSYGQGKTSYREPSLVTGNKGDTNAVLDSIAGTNYDAISDYYNIILGYSSAKEFGKDMQEDFNEMIESVDTYGGFYVGRYETSLRTGEDEITKIAQSKSGPISAIAGDVNTYMWYGLYQKEKEYSSKNSLKGLVGSSMIWGSQYDQMMIWMQTNGIDVTSTTPTNLEGVTTSKNTGSTTGTVETDKLNNIYDLLGNRYEWTLEADSTDCRVRRGGCYGSSVSPCGSGDFYPHYAMGANFGSRLALYVK